MNRPKRPGRKITANMDDFFDLELYAEDLEEYCDYLERKLNGENTTPAQEQTGNAEEAARHERHPPDSKL